MAELLSRNKQPESALTKNSDLDEDKAAADQAWVKRYRRPAADTPSIAKPGFPKLIERDAWLDRSAEPWIRADHSVVLTFRRTRKSP